MVKIKSQSWYSRYHNRGIAGITIVE